MFHRASIFSGCVLQFESIARMQISILSSLMSSGISSSKFQRVHAKLAISFSNLIFLKLLPFLRVRVVFVVYFGLRPRLTAVNGNVNSCDTISSS